MARSGDGGEMTWFRLEDHPFRDFSLRIFGGDSYTFSRSRERAGVRVFQ